VKKIISVNKRIPVGGHLIEMANIDSEYLIELFGDPKSIGSRKSDWEWVLEYEDGELAYIYDWKVGKNYLGDDGWSLEEITYWHIGGVSEMKERISNLVSFLCSSDWAGFDDVKNKMIFSKEYLENRELRV